MGVTCSMGAHTLTFPKGETCSMAAHSLIFLIGETCSTGAHTLISQWGQLALREYTHQFSKRGNLFYGSTHMTWLTLQGHTNFAFGNFANFNTRNENLNTVHQMDMFDWVFWQVTMHLCMIMIVITASWLNDASYSLISIPSRTCHPRALHHHNKFSFRIVRHCLICGTVACRDCPATLTPRHGDVGSPVVMSFRDSSSMREAVTENEV